MMGNLIKVLIPIEMPSLANLHCHWKKKYSIRKKQKGACALLLKPKVISLPKGFYTIRLTRISLRELDPDNLVSCFKNVVDAIAEIFHPGLAPGRADSVGDLLFEFKQEKGRPKGLMVEIY